MADTFRALCAELAKQLDDSLNFTVSGETRRHMKLLTRRARAALADEPAVPDSREPASVTGRPSDGELIQEAIKIGLAFQPHPKVAEVYLPFDAGDNPIDKELIDYARVVLANWGNSAPASPAAEEVAELANLAQREHYSCEDSWYSCPKAEGGCANSAEGNECNCGADAHNAKVDELLAAVLARWGNLAPTPPADGQVVDRDAELLQWSQAK